MNDKKRRENVCVFFAAEVEYRYTFDIIQAIRRASNMCPFSLRLCHFRSRRRRLPGFFLRHIRLKERVQTISFIEIRSLKISKEDWKTPEKKIRIESVLEKCKGHFFKTLNVMIFDRQVRRILVIRKICSFICHSRKRSRRSLWRRMKMVCDCGINIKDFPFVFPRDSCRFTRFRRKF